MIPPELYYAVSIVVPFGVYIVRLEKSLTSIQKDISYIKKNCHHCKQNPDSQNGRDRQEADSTPKMGKD